MSSERYHFVLGEQVGHVMHCKIADGLFVVEQRVVRWKKHVKPGRPRRCNAVSVQDCLYTAAAVATTPGTPSMPRNLET